MAAPAMRLLMAAGQGSDPLAGITWSWRFESDSIVGLVNDDKVATWPDTSGNGRNATQGTDANRPVYKTSIYGSLPGVRFTADMRLVTGTISAVAQPLTTFIVGDTGGAAFQVLVDGLDASNRHYVSSSGGAGNMLEVYAGDSFAGGSVTGSPQIYVVTFNSTSSKFWTGGGAAVTGNGGTHGATGLTLGNRYTSAQACGGDLGAVLTAPSALSLSNINLVGEYLAAKFGASWTTAS